MVNNFHNYPKQRLSFKEKISNEKKWAKDVMDSLILNYSAIGDSTTSSVDEYNRKLSNYQLFNNVLNQKDFERECNPMGIEVGQFQDEVQPYNKIYNKIQVLLGEELKRPFNFRTVLVNSDGIKSKMVEANMLLKEVINQHVQQFIEKITQLVSEKSQAQTSKDQEMIQQEIDTLTKENIPQDILAQYKTTNFLSAKEKLANDLLKYLFHKESIKEKMNDAFKHGLISGEEVVWVGVRNGEPVVEICNSMGVFYHKSQEVKYIQDGLYAGFQTYMSVGDVISNFGDDMSKEDLEKIEKTREGIMGADGDVVGKTMKYHHTDVYDKYMSRLLTNPDDIGSYGSSSVGEDWLVTHVEWMSEKKVYILSSHNDYGDEEKIIVDENFKIPDYAETTFSYGSYGKRIKKYVFDNYVAEERWIKEVWEGTRIGDDIYCNVGPKPYQFRSVDNPNSVKLGYHGLTYSNMNAPSISLVDRMKPFLYLYIFIVHKLKKLIARDKGMVFHLDMTMIPEKLGLEKTLYYLEEMDIDFYNPLQNAESPGAFQRSKITGATSRSNMQHIMNYIQLMAAIDDQISDVAGITRQREGRVLPNEAVTNAQQNILQSSTITEAAYFLPHYKLWESVLETLIQTAQKCWATKGLIKQYVLDDLSLSILKINPNDLENSDFGVFVTSSTRENEAFETIRQLAQPLLQNDKAKLSDIIKIFKATSINELQTQIEKSEKEFADQQQQLIEQQQQQQQQLMEMENASREDAQAHEVDLEYIKTERELLLKELDLKSKELSEIEKRKIEEEINIKKKELELKRKELQDKKEIEFKKIAKSSIKKT